MWLRPDADTEVWHRAAVCLGRPFWLTGSEKPGGRRQATGAGKPAAGGRANSAV